MRIEIIDRFTCPTCNGDLDSIIQTKRGERILKGSLNCDRCGKRYPILNGIVCFNAVPDHSRTKKQKLLRETTLNREISNKWMSVFTEDELRCLKEEWRWMLTHIKKDKGMIHLDFATGTGRFLRNVIPGNEGEIIALDQDYDTCVELSYLLEKTGEYRQVSIVYADARNMPFKEGIYDSISSWHGLDEPEMEKAIIEANRALKEGGCLVASGIHYQKASGSFMRAKKHNMHFLTEDMTRNILTKAGFSRIEYKIFFEGTWNGKEDYLPIFGDFYKIYAVKCKKGVKLG